MQSGLILVVEYKGGHIAESRDSEEKKRIGQLWAKRSNSKCRFVWVENEQWNQIADSARL
jgi:type III restriction enzyme